MSFGHVATRAIVSGATLSTVTGTSSNILSVLVYPISGFGAPVSQVMVFDGISGMATAGSGTLVYSTLSGVAPAPFTRAEIPINSGIVVQGVSGQNVEVLYG